RQGLRLDGQLAGTRPEDFPLDAQPVSQVERAVDLPSLLADRVLADVDLEPQGPVGEVEEARLALRALGHDPAGRLRPLRELLQLLAGEVAVPARDLRNRLGDRIREGIPVGNPPDPLQVVQPVLDEVGFRFRRGPGLLRHVAAKYARAALRRRRNVSTANPRRARAPTSRAAAA